MSTRWRDGNQITLLENGDHYFPAVFTAINQARSKIILETFIWFEDHVGQQLHQALLAAARRGVAVEVLIDGYGSPDLSHAFTQALVEAGVHLRYFDPRPPLFGIRTNVLRRMHRKIVVIDGELAFIGGINYSDDHMSNAGPEAKQDYALRVVGPVVEDIYHYVLSALPGGEIRRRWWQRRQSKEDDHPQPGRAQARLVWRDNHAHRTDIERQYIKMLSQAHRRVTIANAYFFPGYRFLKAMRRAAERGVTVRLVVQGQPDMPIVKVGARLLYRFLHRANIEIYEYRRCPFHGKVAVMDDEWATVGSSNLDPVSLALNLEANLFIHDRAFNQGLTQHLDTMISQDCRRVEAHMLPPRNGWNSVTSALVFHFLRYVPTLRARLPARPSRLAEVAPGTPELVPPSAPAEPEVKP